MDTVINIANYKKDKIYLFLIEIEKMKLLEKCRDILKNNDYAEETRKFLIINGSIRELQSRKMLEVKKLEKN